jgi:protein-S-isoprenylcysteine O-methyltransferase Ste14
MYSWLVTFAWLLAIVYSTIPAYWLLVHPFVDFWRRRGASLRQVGPLWALLWLLAGWLTWPWLHVFLYRTPLAWVPGGLLIAVSLVLYAGSRGELSLDQVLGRAELEPHKHEQRLATAGLRARMRHPLYVAHTADLLGFAVGTGSLALYALSAFAVLTGFLMVHLEERELERRFGDDYRAYKRRVPLLPGLR